jgi:ribulose-phosphate 3-epimerase
VEGTRPGGSSKSPLILAPSLMCADFQYLAAEVARLDDAGADRFHLDVMDGVFVPNFAMGLHDVQAVRAATSRPLDCHLMVANPDLAVEVFAAARVDQIQVHVESTRQIARVLQRIRELGSQAGIAINPGTPLGEIEPILDLVSDVLVMTVNPGFAGQDYLEFVDAKIRKLVELRSERPFTITVDGAISRQRLLVLSSIGVDGFVLGTSALFRRPEAYRDLLDDLRSAG